MDEEKIKQIFAKYEETDRIQGDCVLTYVPEYNYVELAKELVGQIEQTCKNCKFMFDDKYVDDCNTYECTKHNNTIFGGMFEDYWHDLNNIGCKQFEPKGENK